MLFDLIHDCDCECNCNQSALEFIKTIYLQSLILESVNRMYDMGSSLSSRDNQNLMIYPNDPAVILDNLLLGSAYAANNAKVLQYYGITHVSFVSLFLVFFQQLKYFIQHSFYSIYLKGVECCHGVAQRPLQSPSQDETHSRRRLRALQHSLQLRRGVQIHRGCHVERRPRSRSLRHGHK